MTKLTLDCQSQSNPINWIAIRIEQSSNQIQQYPAYKSGAPYPSPTADTFCQITNFKSYQNLVNNSVRPLMLTCVKHALSLYCINSVNYVIITSISRSFHWELVIDEDNKIIKRPIDCSLLIFFLSLSFSFSFWEKLLFW